MRNSKILLTILFCFQVTLGIYVLYDKEDVPVFDYVVDVQSGDIVNDVLLDLDENGVLKYKEGKKYANKNEISLYQNSYLVSSDMTVEEIFDIISNPTSNIEEGYSFVIVEGATIDQIAEQVSKLKAIDMTVSEIINYWDDTTNLTRWINQYDFLTNSILDEDIKHPLEGYFLPVTLQAASDVTIEDVTLMMLDYTDAVLSNINMKGNDVHSVLTLASIVERETLYPEDKPKVASVFLNRLREGMKIQSDITVLYGMNEHKAQVTFDDLEYDSPYNTYLYEGLTPGPIASPSVESIEGVVNAPKTNYFYFFAKQDTGEIIYTETYDEHIKVSEDNAWNFEE